MATLTVNGVQLPADKTTSPYSLYVWRDRNEGELTVAPVESSQSSRRPYGRSVGDWASLFLLCLVCVIAGVMNNYTFVQMGKAMPDFPAFLLYGTTAFYVLLYIVWLAVRTRQNHREGKPMYVGSPSSLWMHYVGVAVLVVGGGICSQFSDPFVGGTLQSFVNQMTLPLTCVLVSMCLKHRFSSREKMGVLVVFVASVLPVISPFIAIEEKYEHSLHSPPKDTAHSQYNSLFWVAVYVLSDLPSAIVNVWEEHLFSSAFKADEIHYLAWTNALTLPGYIASIPLAMVPGFTVGGPLTWPEVKEHEWDALRCFAGQTPLPDGCQPGAWLPVCGFVAAVTVYFVFLAVLIKREGSTFQVIVNALVTPLSALAFSSPLLVGADAQPLSYSTILGCILIPIGIVVYKSDDLFAPDPMRVEEILPLISRH